MAIRNALEPCLALRVAAALVVAGLAGCTGGLIDPTTNAPIQPSELTAKERDHGGPDAVPPNLQGILPGPAAAQTASEIRISRLSRVERYAVPPLVDIRLDALGQDGSFATIAGDLRILIHCPSADPPTLAFDVTLKTAPEVKRRRDEVLEQFVLRLAPRWRREPDRGEKLEISANLLATDGSLLRSRIDLVW